MFGTPTSSASGLCGSLQTDGLKLLLRLDPRCSPDSSNVSLDATHAARPHWCPRRQLFLVARRWIVHRDDAQTLVIILPHQTCLDLALSFSFFFCFLPGNLQGTWGSSLLQALTDPTSSLFGAFSLRKHQFQTERCEVLPGREDDTRTRDHSGIVWFLLTMTNMQSLLWILHELSMQSPDQDCRVCEKLRADSSSFHPEAFELRKCRSETCV